MRSILTTTRKFYAYQKERFPMAILGLSLLPATLSSGVIASANPTALQISFAVIASIMYLLHIRVIDEHRDYGHDNIHHTARPVQAGNITKEELRHVDFIAVTVLIVIATIVGRAALMATMMMLAYSYVAGKEFFLGERLRRHFFIYNSVNLVQMVLMQVFVYSVFANPIPLNVLVVTHFLFTTVGTIVFELVRKLKIPGCDGTGKDTYTWYVGFSNAIGIYLSLVLLNTALFFKIATMLSLHTTGLFIFSAGSALLVCVTVLIHLLKKSHQTDKLMQLSFLTIYGIFNLIIYFLAR